MKAARFVSCICMVLVFTVLCVIGCSSGDPLVLRIVEVRELKAGVQKVTEDFYVHPQLLMAAGGSPQLTMYQWSLANLSTFPAGMTVDQYGVFKSTGGTPVKGTHTFEMEVSDGNETARKVFEVNVVEHEETEILPYAVLQQCPGESTYSLNDGVAGEPYGATLPIFGGTPPYSFAQDESYTGDADFNLSGLSIDAAHGVVNGTISESMAGKTLRFKVVVTDSEPDTSVYNPVYEIVVN